MRRAGISQQIADSDRLVTVRTGATWTDPPTEHAAVLAPLFPDVPRLAGWAFIDNG